MDIEKYLDEVLGYANLAFSDEKRVRGELRNHILEMIDNGKHIGISEMEVMQMVNKEFGSPEELGKMIAKAKGRFLTYLKKQARHTAITLPIVFGFLIVLHLFVFQTFKVTANAVADVPSNSRVLVNKLSKTVGINDVVVFRGSDKHALVGKIKSLQDDTIVVSRSDSDYTISKKNVIGKVFFVYSWHF
jgi:hypothetical protein